jgi:G3E family GTPase
MRCYTIVRQVTEWHGRCDVPELVQTEMTATARTPITILTGFLGAGKTSLLSRLLRDPRFSDTAVVINEFGEVGLDHLLVEHLAEEPVVEMTSGCLCCTVRRMSPRTRRR